MPSAEASSTTSAPTSSTALSAAAPTKAAPQEGFKLDKYRKTKDAASLVAWVKSEHEKSKQARETTRLQWYTNMAMFYGQQWVEQTSRDAGAQFRATLQTPKKPYYHQRKVINRTRSFVRWEMSKFLSQTPTAVSVPGSSEDQDQRSAFAAEQVFQSVSNSKKLRSHYARSVFWTVIAGNGFVKTVWDQECVDKVSGQSGDIRYGSVTPFHLFVPDLREEEIEDQPFIITAYTKSVEWCYHYFAEELKGITLSPSTSSANTLLDEGYLNLSEKRTHDSVIVYEAWVKPGATKLLPQGGLIVTVDDHLISMTEGLPYTHGQYPFTHFGHIPTGKFYADSPLNDLNHLNREYNQLRSEISEAGKRMAKPQLLAQRGSLVSKITNEPGLVIEYNPGTQPPQPIPLAPLPQYYLDQQDRILMDWEDLSGQRDVTQGSAPAGVTAGTAINYLQEAANKYLTPQFQSVEDGYEKLSGQTVELFVQYVDMPRKIKTIGADMAFDTMLLSGADIAGGTDIRIEAGSSVGESAAAKEARIMDMFSIGLIQDPNIALKLLSVGGVQKVEDILNVAEKKAQRENTKMKSLKLEDIARAKQERELQIQQVIAENPGIMEDPETGPQIQALMEQSPLLVPVADFDIHPVHMETHDRFRMSQEYEALAPELREQFDMHNAEHKRLDEQAKMMQFLQQIPGDGTEEGDQTVDVGADPLADEAGEGSGALADDPAAAGGGGATMAANGAVPAPPTSGGMA